MFGWTLTTLSGGERSGWFFGNRLKRRAICENQVSAGGSGAGAARRLEADRDGVGELFDLDAQAFLEDDGFAEPERTGPGLDAGHDRSVCAEGGREAFLAKAAVEA